LLLAVLLGECIFDDFLLFVQFFKKHGVVSVQDEYQLFNHVTGLQLHGEGEEFLAQVI